jgi:ABC-type Fe3+/spermidine/putrescine transport system ATPase subunit
LDWFRNLEIILLDEPFSHIDNFKKQSLRKKFFSYLKSNSITCVMATHDKEDVLPYSDTMVVLENHEILVEGSPVEIYNNPIHPLVAAFFGDFSIINNIIYYSHQVFVVENSGLKAVVKEVFYKGSFFLIEAEYNTKTVYFNHPSRLPKKSEVYLKTTV